MCKEVKKSCECSQSEAQFHMRDNIMAEEVIDRLFCPSCSPKSAFNAATMIHDNGWIIEYDMMLAKMLGTTKMALPAEQVTPEFLFDLGYASWREMYPGETEDIAEERQEIIKRKDENPRRYLEEINSWAVTRINRLKNEGWRKAQLA